MGFVIPGWALGAAVILIALQIGRAISGRARYLARGARTSEPEVTELRDAVDAMQRRIGELEERVDFTERLLAKQRDARDLPG